MTIDNPQKRDGLTLRDSHCILILFFITVALFRKSLFGGPVILSHPIFLDLTNHIYPWRLYGFGLLKKGIIPLWNPYLFCGSPFIANWHSAVFYPPNIIFLLVPTHIALNYSIAFHFFLTGAFTYAFVRYLLKDRFSAFVSALVFILSGPYIAQLLPGHIFNPLPWFPLSLLLAELAIRRKQIIYYLLGGLVLALQITAGHPQYMLYCFGTLVLYFIYRAFLSCRDNGNLSPLGMIAVGLLIVLVVGIGLSAVQLLPSWEFKDYSSRALFKGPESVSEVSFPPENLITMLVPGFFGDMMGVRYWGRWLLWETCLYVGILPLVLALVGSLLVRNRYAFFFLILAILSTVLAFGAYSPFFKMLYYYVPGFKLFRGHAKFIFLAAFSIASLAGYGCNLVTSPQGDRRRRLALLGRIVFILAALVLLVCIIITSTGGQHSSIWERVLTYRGTKGFEGTPPPDISDNQLISSTYVVALRGILIAALLMVASAVITLLAAKERSKPAVLKSIILIVVLADLLYFGAKYIMVSPLSTCYWPRGITNAIDTDRSAFRILAPNIAVPGANQTMNDGIYAIDGYETVNVGVYKEYVDFSQGISTSQAKASFSINKVTPMLEALGLKYLILPEYAYFNRRGYTRRLSSSGAAIYERKSPLPRAYIVHQAKIVKDTGAALEQIWLTSLKPTSGVILEEELEPLPSDTSGSFDGEEYAEITNELPNRVTIEAGLRNPGYLVLSDVFYPGWEVRINGEPGTILRANHAFRAVPLNAGRYRVCFSYRPRSFKYGSTISIFSLFGFILALVILLRRK